MAILTTWVEQLAEILPRRGLRLATVESCTGGQIGAALTDRAGSSDWYEGGWITYSNDFKIALGVPAELIERQGAVSEAVARAMAEAGQRAARVELSVAVTGVAGPGGGSEAKPVGLVWIAWVTEAGTDAEHFHFDGDRAEIRHQATEAALAGLLHRL